MKKQLRHSILTRDGNRCRVCGTDKNLEVHHIVTTEEGRWLNIGKDVLEHPNNLLTLCQQCHSVTLFGVPHYLLKLEEREDLRVIRTKRQELLSAKQKLKEEYHGNWNTIGYREKKRKIEKSLQECQYRQNEIKKVAKKRRDERRNEVLATLLGMPKG